MLLVLLWLMLLVRLRLLVLGLLLLLRGGRLGMGGRVVARRLHRTVPVRARLVLLRRMDSGLRRRAVLRGRRRMDGGLRRRTVLRGGRRTDRGLRRRAVLRGGCGMDGGLRRRAVLPGRRRMDSGLRRRTIWYWPALSCGAAVRVLNVGRVLIRAVPFRRRMSGDNARAPEVARPRRCGDGRTAMILRRAEGRIAGRGPDVSSLIVGRRPMRLAGVSEIG